ncbi:XRE family transcriptional regulator [Aeromonas veronii]|uniref:XRE family transcriptional regulator n=1 Tax=Aeromonas veronii TaxID=654 RepID=UPI003D2206A7
MEKIDLEIKTADRFFLEERKNRFSIRLKEAMNGIANTTFAKACGVSEGAIRQYLKGSSVPNLEVLAAISYVTGRSISWLVGEEPPKGAIQSSQVGIKDGSYIDTNNDFVMVNDLSGIEAAAGGGTYVTDDEEAVGRMAFRREWIAREGLKAQALRIIRARGDSMEPTIQDGAPILVEAFAYTDENGRVKHLRIGNTPEEVVTSDGVYVIRLNERLLVKRLQLDLLGGLLVKSDNATYDTLHVPADRLDDIAVVGRVVWTGRKL